MNRWRKFCDGWFTYFYNVETGERKFNLEPGDVLVDQIEAMRNEEYVTIQMTKEQVGILYEMLLDIQDERDQDYYDVRKIVRDALNRSYIK